MANVSVPLLQLPNELLVVIFADFTGTELYHVLISCRRLHSIALPLLLALHGITGTVDDVEISIPQWDSDWRTGSRLDALSVLGHAFHITSLKRLSCFFPGFPRWGHFAYTEGYSRSQDQKDVARILPLIHSMRRLKAFISRLSSIDEMTIVFSDRHSQGHLNGSTAELEVWSTAMAGLLNTIIERSCITLRIQNGAYMTGLYEHMHSQEPKLTTPRPFLKHALHFLTPISTMLKSTTQSMVPRLPIRRSGFVRAPVILTETTYKARRRSTLRELYIESSIPSLLLPPVYHWTFSVLHSSPLTRLSLYDVKVSSYQIWRAVLPLLAEVVCESLQDLTVRRCDSLHPLHLLEFLSKLKLLVIFTTDKELYSGWWNQDLPVPKLHHLASVTAPWSTMAHLLGSRQSRSHLQHVYILYTFPEPADDEAEQVACALAPILLKLGQCTSVALDLKYHHPHIPLDGAKAKNVPDCYNPITSLVIGTTTFMQLTLDALCMTISGYPGLQKLVISRQGFAYSEASGDEPMLLARIDDLCRCLPKQSSKLRIIQLADRTFQVTNSVPPFL